MSVVAPEIRVTREGTVWDLSGVDAANKCGEKL